MQATFDDGWRRRSRWARSPSPPAPAASSAPPPAPGWARPPPTGSCCVAAGGRDRGHRAGGGLLQLRDGRARGRRRRDHQRARQGGAGRDHPARGAREPARVGVRPLRDAAAAGLGRRRRAGIALPTTGWLGFTVAAALLVLVVGLVLWSLSGGRARPRRLARRPDDPGGTQWPRGGRGRRAARSLLLAGCGGGDDGPGDVRVEVGAQDVTARPPRAARTARGPLRRHAAGHRGLPGRRHHAHRARRRWPSTAGACRSSTSSSRRSSAPSTSRRARTGSTASTPPTSSRRPSTCWSSRTRAATAACGPAPGRSASSAPAASSGRRRRPAPAPSAAPTGVSSRGRWRPRAAPSRPCATRRGRGAGRGAAPRRRRRAA